MIHYSSDVINYEIRFKEYHHKLMMTHFINILWHCVNEVINQYSLQLRYFKHFHKLNEHIKPI